MTAGSIGWKVVMGSATLGRFAVLSPDLIVTRCDDFKHKFVKDWVRMKRTLAPPFRKGKLGFRQDKKAKALAADGHSRRLLKSAVMQLPKDVRLPVIALARAVTGHARSRVC